MAVKSRRASEFRDSEMFELRPHRRAGVELEGDDAFGERQLRVLVGEVEDRGAVKEMLDAVALGDDDVVVPIVEFEQLLESCGIEQGGEVVFFPSSQTAFSPAWQMRPRLPPSS